MTAAREEFHHLVDQLPEEKIGPLLALVRDNLAQPGVEGDQGWPLPEWVGMLHSGKSDLGARSGDILRAELGHRPA
jgi:hypothetical protein